MSELTPEELPPSNYQPTPAEVAAYDQDEARVRDLRPVTKTT
ncbi:MAG TPA: hypothetical protein VGO07_06000 [Candidatus Saccharimonadales bacterium]|nr:hypothetical protein [Candidatus Saccharimonadales bacterium]